MEESTINIEIDDLTLITTDPQLKSMTDLRGSNIVLYFYPKDNTPGCTQESLDFKQFKSEFDNKETVIVGISRDSLKSHHKFKDKFELPFELISDEDETICQRFGVMKDKNMFGKKVRGIERSTFLFDKQGVCVREWRKVKVPGHVEEVLEAIE